LRCIRLDPAICDQRVVNVSLAIHAGDMQRVDRILLAVALARIRWTTSVASRYLAVR
jgi:hypothetical protein